MHLVKLAVLGATGCGKTSLIRQFVRHEFCDDDNVPTVQKKLYYPTVVVEDRLYEVQIVDLPPTANFPEDSYEEWTYYKGWGLRSANAYVLIFDIDRPETFQVVKRLRDQIVASRSDPLIVVAGNKQDMLLTDHSPSSTPGGSGSGTDAFSEMSSCKTGTQKQQQQGAQKHHGSQQQLQQQQQHHSHKQQQQQQHHHHHFRNHQRKPKSRQSSNDRILSSNGSTADQQHQILARTALDVNKEYANLVKKQWKCPYVECSAKYNWHVTTVFLELMKLIERQMDTNQQKSVSHSGSGRRRCKIQ